MKKIVKILGAFVLIVIALLALSPLLFKGTLEKLVLKNLDQNINATVTWADFNLSLFRSFPDAALTIKDFKVINKAPFDGDTLASGRLLKLDMGITQLFKSGDSPIKIDAFSLENAFINIKVDSTGQANYDIAVKDDPANNEAARTSNEGFRFDLKQYNLKDSQINYLDEASQTFLILKDLNHEGSGDFSLAQSELETKTDVFASLRIGKVNYLKNNTISLDAVFQLDLENQKYSFLDNNVKINELPLTFDGFLKINEDNSEIDLSFKTPSSDFKNFLAVIPKVYVKELDGVTTTGNFIVDGKLKGNIDETHIPKMDIKIASDNASFKYPDLPKAVQNISIDAQLKNDTGLIKDTYLNIGGLTFRIDDELFTANGNIRNITANVLVDMAVKGTLNLANIEKVLPLELEQSLTGVFKADVTTNFDMKSVETEQYQNIKTLGSASITGFTYNDEAFKDELKIANADVTFTPGNIQLEKMNASSGQTDIEASGNIENLIPWIMAKQDLKGRFNVKSNTFNVNDFMTSEEEASGENNSSSEKALADDSVKIPDFLDATIDFSATKVIYDNIVLDNAKGTVSIKDEAANLSNVTSSAFGGDVAFSGNVSTKTETPTFVMDLDLKKIDIGQSFSQLDLLKFIAPVAKALDGDLNTTIKLNGDLNNDLTPKLSSLAGNALAQILTAEVNPENAPLLSTLGEQVSFLNLDKLSLQDLSTALTFNNGKIEVKPFNINVEGVNITAGGSHGLDKSIDYNLTMDVPAKYLGGDVTNLLSKLDPKDANEMSVTIPVGMSGTFTNPNISLNTQAAIQTLTQKLIEKQTQDLKDKGTNILQDLIGGSNTPKDSTTTTGTTTQQTATDVVEDIIGGLFGNRKKKQDTTKNNN